MRAAPVSHAVPLAVLFALSLIAGLAQAAQPAALRSAAALQAKSMQPVVQVQQGSAAGKARAPMMHARRLAPVERRDIDAAFGQAACAGTLGDLPFKLWSLGLTDARIEGRVLHHLGAGGPPIEVRQAEHTAKALARLRRLGGYAYGACPSGAAWAAAFPAPVPLVPAAHLTLPTAALASRCASWRADFAPRDRGTLRLLKPQGNKLDLGKLGDGVVSVTCQPKDGRRHGPVLWYLYPVGLGPMHDVPLADYLKDPQTPSADLMARALGPWINRIRARASLAPLAIRDDLSEQASLLAIDGTLVHDRPSLRHAAQSLAKGHVQLLGEDRVKGQSLTTMAWLLWNSPRHRALLLSPNATALGLAGRAVGKGTLAVITVGKSATGPVARTVKPPRRG